MTAQTKTVFTIEEANKTLPLVRSIVEDVASRWGELVKVRDEYGNSSPEHDRIMRELAEFVQELKIIGCHLRDFESGLVEFPTLIDGKEACFSWQHGEDTIAFLTDPEDDQRRLPLPDDSARS